MRKIISATIFLALIVAPHSGAAADAGAGRFKLTASDGSASERFGISVAVSGNTAVVGAPHEGSPIPTEHGAAYVFTRTGETWIQQAKLTAADGSEGDRLGFSVAVSGDTVVVGAFWDDSGDNADQGSAYVFTRTGETWTQQARLTAADGAASDQFGYSVAVSSDTAVVGATGGDVGGKPDQGSAYVFTRTGGTWSQAAKLTARDGSAGDALGQSVSVSNDTAVVGAVTSDGDAADQGSAHVFTRTGGSWTEQAELTAADGSAGDQFGFWVGVDGDIAVVGAPFDDVSASDQGSAHVFTRTAGTWTEQAELIASDGSAADLFGRSVAVSGDTILVGAQYDDVGASIKQGSVYVFTPAGGTWTEQTKLSASEGAAGALFGVSVAVSGETGLVGAGFETVGANIHQGAAYVFRGDDVSPQPERAAPTRVRLKGPKSVMEGKKARLKTTVRPCPDNQGETVELFRGKKKIASAVSNPACIATFKVRIKRTSTFRAVSPAGRSNKLKVRAS